VARGKTAEIVEKYVEKGKEVGIKDKLKNRIKTITLKKFRILCSSIWGKLTIAVELTKIRFPYLEKFIYHFIILRFDFFSIIK